MLRFLLLCLMSPIVCAGFTLGATSTTTNSGLMDYLLSHYEQQTNQKVKVVTGGSGFILKQLENNDVEIAITHQEQLEQTLLVKYPSGKRQPFMYNYFIVIGPKDDPAAVAKATSFAQALTQMYTHKSKFISRGDNSGTHLFELNIWEKLHLIEKERQCPCYIQSGQDMGPTINMASELGAYTIADQGTWLAYEPRSPLKLLYQGKDDGMNVYSVIQLKETAQLSPEAAEFINWLLQEKTRTLINDFKINGQQGFYSVN